MTQNIRYALRRLRATPLFTVFAVLTLALGIGATTTIYSFVYTLILRHDNIPDVERLVNIYHREFNIDTLPNEYRFSWPDYQDLRAQQTQFSNITAWYAFGEAVVANGHTELIRGEGVDGGYFSLVRARPALGRLLQESDNAPGAPPVAVISHALWQNWYGGDPSAVGSRIRIANEIVEIVGVVEPEFRGVATPNLRPTPIWIPLVAGFQLSTSAGRPGSRLNNRNAGLIFVKGRLKPGSTLESARQELAGIAARLDISDPMTWERMAPRLLGGRKWFLKSAAEIAPYESGGSFSLSFAAVLMIGVGLVLLVACTNLANLMLARASRRSHEVAVRRALGASRWRLIAEQLLESCLLAVAGGLGGILLADIGMHLLSGPIHLGTGTFVEMSLTMTPAVVGIAIAATGLTLLVFGLAPAFYTTRTSIETALRADSVTAGLRWRGRRFLITAQVIVSTILVTIAFLCAQQLHSLATQKSGVDLDRIAVAIVNLKFSHYDEPHARAVMDDALQTTRRQVGVERAALASTIPLGQQDYAQIKAGDQHSGADLIVGTPEMFEVFGLRLKRGRTFTDGDAHGGDPVAVISELTATQLFGATDPIGRQIELVRMNFNDNPELRNTEAATVVGVVADPNPMALGRSGERVFRRNGYAFRPWAQTYSSTVALVARTPGDPSTLVEPLTRAIHKAGPDALVYDAGTGLVLAGADSLIPTIVGAIAALLGSFALALSLTGLYGVLSHMVSGRTREMGIRMALGADRRGITTMILLQGLEPVIAGLVLGLTIGAGARMAFQSLIVHYLPAIDSVVFVFVPIPFAIAAMIACYIPARRASRVDPMVALRDL